MTKRKERCDGCRFFAEPGFYQGNLGECRFNPPSLPTEGEIGVWPRVAHGDFCGQWQAPPPPGPKPAGTVACRNCDGTGRISIFGPPDVTERCPNCGGSGKFSLEDDE